MEELKMQEIKEKLEYVNDEGQRKGRTLYRKYL